MHEDKPPSGDISEETKEKLSFIISTFTEKGKYSTQYETYEYCDMIMRIDDYHECILINEDYSIIFSYDMLANTLDNIKNIFIIDSIVEIINFQSCVEEQEEC